jgi:hypothetical protein
MGTVALLWYPLAVLCGAVPIQSSASVGIVTRLLTAISRGFVRLPLAGAGVFVSSSARPDRLGAHTWGVGGGGGRPITHTHNCVLCPSIFHNGHGDHPTSYTMGTEKFVGVKRPGPEADHQLPSSTEVEE